MYPAPVRHPAAGVSIKDCNGTQSSVILIVFRPHVHLQYEQGPPPQGPIKFTIADTLERIKEEFNFLQAQYHRQVSTTYNFAMGAPSRTARKIS